MKIKVSEATDIQIDWLVAKCEGKIDDCEIHPGNVWYGRVTSGFVQFNPTTNWAQGGPIIEREKIEITPPVPEWSAGYEDRNWMATSLPAVPGDATLEVGPTPLIAAMRCYVASKLGDEVEVPDEPA